MDPVHDRGSMDPVHESGPWTRSKVGVHGPLVRVLSSPALSCVCCYENKQIWQKNVNRAQYFFALLRIKFLSFRGHRKLRLRGRKTFWRSIRRNQGYQKVSIHRSL